MQENEGNGSEQPPRASDRLEFALERDPQGVRVRLKGELDLATTPALDRLLNELANDGHDRLLIDLSELQFMDSTGLGSIVRAHRHADANGHSVTLRRGSPQVQRLLEVTGMLDRFAFED